MGGVFTPPDSAVAYVWGMWTAPEARGRGYASGLLADLVNLCRARHLGVRLHVTEGNQAARRLYTAHGFQIDRRVGAPPGRIGAASPGAAAEWSDLRFSNSDSRLGNAQHAHFAPGHAAAKAFAHASFSSRERDAPISATIRLSALRSGMRTRSCP